MTKIVSFSFLTALVIASNAEATVCIGVNDETSPNVVADRPTVEIDRAGLYGEPGGTVFLRADFTVDENEGAQPKFYWCAETGNLTQIEAEPNYSQVALTIPENIERSINISVALSDFQGSSALDFATVYVGIRQGMDVTVSDPYVLLDFQSAVGSTGTVEVGGQIVESQWSDNQVQVSLNALFDSGIAFPSMLNVVADNGETLFSGMFPFQDTNPYAWYSPSLLKLWKSGILQGYSGSNLGNYGPHNPALRSEFVSAVVRALVSPSPVPAVNVTSPIFQDVKNSDWFYPHVQYAAENGIVHGCMPEEGFFCPSSGILRGEAAKVLALSFSSVSSFLNDCEGEVSFQDVDLDAWYAPYVCAIKKAAVTSGYTDGTYKPEEMLSRAEMARMICIAKFSPLGCGAFGPEPLLPEEDDSTEDGADSESGSDPGAGGDDGQDSTGPGGSAENPGDASELFILDGQMTTSCTFVDVDQTQWYAEAVNALCSAGILVGYWENGERVFVKSEYRPEGYANLVEVLAVFMSTADYQGTAFFKDESAYWYQGYLDEAVNRNMNLYGLDISDHVMRGQALEWLAQLFYDYTGTDPVGFLVNQGITTGEDTQVFVSRYEMAVLAYRALQDIGRQDEIPFGLWGEPAPKPTPLGSEIVAKALENVGVLAPYTDGESTYCARFVRMMFEKPMEWSDASGMCDHYSSLGLVTEDQSPTTGSVICYAPNATNEYFGHVAIAVGDGTEVGATSLTQGVTHRDSVYGTAYQGWIAPSAFSDNYPQ